MANAGTTRTLLKPRREWFGLSSPMMVIGAFAAVTERAINTGVVFVDGPIRFSNAPAPTVEDSAPIC